MGPVDGVITHRRIHGRKATRQWGPVDGVITEGSMGERQRDNGGQGRGPGRVVFKIKLRETVLKLENSPI